MVNLWKKGHGRSVWVRRGGLSASTAIASQQAHAYPMHLRGQGVSSLHKDLLDPVRSAYGRGITFNALSVVRIHNNQAKTRAVMLMALQFLPHGS